MLRVQFVLRRGLDAKKKALEGLRVDPCLKLSLDFASFWDGGAQVLSTRISSTATTSFPTSGRHCRCGLRLSDSFEISGPKAAYLSTNAMPAHLEGHESLSVVSGGRPRSEFELEAAYLHNWQTDPFARALTANLAGENDRPQRAWHSALWKTLLFSRVRERRHQDEPRQLPATPERKIRAHEKSCEHSKVN